MLTAQEHRQIQAMVALALAEDLGDLGDITGNLVPKGMHAKATVLCRQPMLFCGQAWVEEIFRQVDDTITYQWCVAEQEWVHAHSNVLHIFGDPRSLLKAERCVLNFLQFLCGIATRAHHCVQEVRGLKVTLLDTRKTIPGLRVAQKYAVRCGGVHNHRMGLFDAFLIKENHINALGSIEAALKKARAAYPNKLLEIEVEHISQLKEAVSVGADRIMLDNFHQDEIVQAVHWVNGRVPLEVSGGVSLNNLRVLAQTGVDFISIGTLTKDIQAIDLSMRFVPHHEPEHTETNPV